MRLTATLGLALAFAFISVSAIANNNRDEFQPASSVAETLSQHKRLPAPDEEVWWTPTGKDMAWNNKNLQQLFPTVPVYRDGPVRELAYELNPAIDNFKVSTPDGPVRNVLDMASGVDCSDGDYARGTCYYDFEASLNDAVRTPKTPDTPYESLAKMRPGHWAPQGQGFDYSGANTFVLSWIVEKLMGMPFQDAVTKEFWHKIGAEGDAAFYAARYGIALSTGGFLAKPRDMARFGLLFTPSYKVVSDERIISDHYLKTILNGGRPELLRNARHAESGRDLSGIKHNVYQWDLVFNNNDIYKGGWAGQGLLINPDRDLVAVYIGYAKDDNFSELSVLPRLRQVLNGVYGEK